MGKLTADNFKHFIDGIMYALINTDFKDISSEKDLSWSVRRKENVDTVKIFYNDYIVAETEDPHVTVIVLLFTTESERKIVKEIYDALEQVYNASEPEMQGKEDLYIDIRD